MCCYELKERNRLLRSLVIVVIFTICAAFLLPAYALDLNNPINEPCLDGSGDALPRDAYPLPVTRAGEIQSMLNQHRKVRLEPHGNYAAGGGPITLSSGQELYGISGSKIGRVVVADGATGVVLQGVDTDGISFLASEKVTRGNCFRRITGPVTIKDAKLEDNLFVDISNTQLNIDTRQRGYLRNNRFIRVMTHSSYPAIQMRGDAKRLSGANVFLWLNILTPLGDGVIVDGQDDVTFAGLDAESWNWSKQAKNPAMMTVTNTGTLRLMAASGGDAKSGIGHYLDAGADEAQIFGTKISRVGDPTVTLQSQVRRYFLSNIQNLSISVLAHDSFSVKAFTDSEPEVLVRGVNLGQQNLAADDIAELQRMFVNHELPVSSWSRPVLAPIPDPAGPDWKVGIDSRPDSSGYLQGLVDTQGIARVPAGIYYITKPIRLRSGQGIIGEGATRTAIIAKNPNIDMIVSDEHIKKTASTAFTLADLTLQGGRNGIHHDVAGAGAGAQFNLVYLSHVTFRDMSDSGIFIDGIYGWDNNFIDNVNFIRCAEAGVKQRVNPLYISGDAPGMSYMDKNVFYRCQFVESGRGIDLQARREDNLNAFIDCAFRDNTESAVSMKNNFSAVFANTDFINNGGSPVISSDKPTYFVNSYFRAGKNNVAMLPDESTCEGCVFEKGGASAASIMADKTRVFLYNSKSIDVPLGKITAGVLMNTFLQEDRQLNEQALFVDNGNIHVMAYGLPKPVSQLLSRRGYETQLGK